MSKIDSINVKKPDEYEIKKIVLQDGTEIDVNKLTHVAIIKHSQKGNKYNFKLTHCMRTEQDSKALSNQCLMLAHVFNMMDKHKVSFEEAATLYDNTMLDLRAAYQRMQNHFDNQLKNKGGNK